MKSMCRYRNEWPLLLHESCQVCLAAALHPLYSVEEKTFSYLMMRCKACGHVQIGRSQLHPDEMQKANDLFQRWAERPEEAWAMLDKSWGEFRRAAFCNILKHLERLGFKDGKMLDVGSAFGHFLSLARERGFNVLGVDVSATARHLARKKLGIETVEQLQSIPESAPPFDVIVCAETLYYHDDVRSACQALRSLLKPNGCLVLKIKGNRTGAFRFAAMLSQLRGNLLRLRAGGYLYGANMHGYHLFKTRGIHRLLRGTGFDILETVNEKYTIPIRFSLLGTVKVIRTAWTFLVLAVTLGKIKVSQEVTVYATPCAM